MNTTETPRTGHRHLSVATYERLMRGWDRLLSERYPELCPPTPEAQLQELVQAYAEKLAADR